jgi:uncharacterized protein (DUF885 family)
VPNHFDTTPQTQAADVAFACLADSTLTDLLQHDPVRATALGDHRFDAELPDYSIDAQAEFARQLDDRLTELDAVDDVELSHLGLLDFETLRAAVAARLFDVTELREPEWNPIAWNPGNAVWSLIARPVLDPPDLVRALTSRLAQVPSWLEAGRDTLGELSRVHTETALVQLEGTLNLFAEPITEIAATDAGLANALLAARAAAVEAVQQHRVWLGKRLQDDAGLGRSPRYGAARFAATLWHRLDGGPDLDRICKFAHHALEDTQVALSEVAGMLLGESPDAPDVVRRALAAATQIGVIEADTILSVSQHALERATAFTRDHDLVTVYDDPIEIREMPEFHRGGAVAYCDDPGVLESATLPTLFCIAPPPTAWSDARKQSFYREYNAHTLQLLAIHEGIPGHALQLAHSKRSCGPTKLRQILTNGAFIEGWAVYTEELLVSRDYPGITGDPENLALQVMWLKARLRVIANLLLDIGVHADEMSEAQAMHLMTVGAFQEEGEAVGKWRRAQLTAGQLSTYFLGYLEVRGIADDLATLNPDLSIKQVHDTILSFGSPSPRVLRDALGLPELLAPLR